MCLTLRNAAAVLDHQDGRSAVPGYTRTRHHIRHLDPGDWWFPAPEPLPHIATGVHRRDGPDRGHRSVRQRLLPSLRRRGVHRGAR